jgi:ribose transport system ATP-binding protein
MQFGIGRPSLQPTSLMQHSFLELIDVTKTYPGVVALDKVSLSVEPGEVLGLVGENGAGKSTLMRIVGGIVEPSSGLIRLRGVEHPHLSVRESNTAGIAFVHQEPNLFGNLDVAANILIGREPTWGGPLKLVHRRELYSSIEPLLHRIGIDFAPDTPVSELSLAQMQLVEIAKALSLDSRLVILDEPTSSLTISETEQLLRVIAGLRRNNVSVIFISHRLNEVERCADRVTVLRDGRVAGELHGNALRSDAMIRLMIGRDLKSLYIPPSRQPGDPLLEIDAIRTPAHPEHVVSLTVRAGEILGLAGLVGSGRTELARCVFGIDRPLSGKVKVHGRTIPAHWPRAAIDQGLFLVPEDRKRSGLLLEETLIANISLPDLPNHSRAGIVNRTSEIAVAESQRRKLNIRSQGLTEHVRTLSGGNQQKVVLAKWLALKPCAVVFDEPTRGIDVGAKNEIYAIMRTLADRGVAILMISSDMEEIIGVSDRIAVMHEGRLSGTLERSQFSEASVLRLAVGSALN